jgi:hypothetical protein
MIIEVPIPFDKKTSITFKPKNFMNNRRISTARRPLVRITQLKSIF